MIRAVSLLPALLIPIQVTAAPPCPPWLASHVQVGERIYRVEVAATPAQWQRGLSGRDHLAPGEGMWFVLPLPGIHGFWMKDMTFPIDLVWITPQGLIAGVETLPPCAPGSCPIQYPPEPVGFVLETNAGTVPELEGVQIRWLCQPE